MREWPSPTIVSTISSRVAVTGSATMSMRGTITSCTRRSPELEHGADHLLLLGLDDALLAAALDEDHQLLGA